MNNDILQLQKEIRDKQAKLVELRKTNPPEPVNDYELTDHDGNRVLLSTLFGNSDELLVIHNMGKSCSYCTMWADGFRGFTEIIADRMPWVLVSPDDHSLLKKFAESRDWKFNSLSFAGTSLAQDLNFYKEMDGKASYMPGVSALIKKDGQLFRAAYDYFGPGDLYNPAWHFFDLFPSGAKGWRPKYIY